MKTHTLALIEYRTRAMWADRDNIQTAINGWITPSMVADTVPVSQSTVGRALRILVERGDLVRERSLNPPIFDGNVSFAYAPAEAVETGRQDAREAIS